LPRQSGYVKNAHLGAIFFDPTGDFSLVGRYDLLRVQCVTMTDEAAFQNALDELAAQFGDDRRAQWLLDRVVETYAVFADWLEEQGDWRASGYRWLGRHRKSPRLNGRLWEWWQFGDSFGSPDDLPTIVWTRMPGHPDRAAISCKAYPSRRDAEWALCKAVLSLEADT
jgi:hypothetical protein